VDRCPAHPDQETMVPCLECGGYFCRICDPPSKAGQYCSRCYREILRELEARRAKGLAGARGFFRARGREDVRARTDAAGEPAPPETSEVAKKTRGVAAGEPGLPAQAWSYVVDAAKEHFPLVVAEKEKYEGEPLLRECWYKLVVVVLSGAAIWTLIACLTHQRRPWVSVVVALLVAAGTVWSLGTRFGFIVGLFAMALALLSLAIGELAVQALFRYGVIKTLDLQAVSLSQLKSKGGLYSRFFYNVLVLRFLPSAVVAFLVGWWPNSRRIGWRGFRISGRG
jgi:hypothetical protein